MKSTIALLLIICTLPAFSNDRYWPETINEAVLDIISDLSEEEKKWIKSLKKEQLIKLHHGFGTGIRNDYGLWKGNKTLIESACGKPCHPDTASMVIIKGVWSKLNEVP
ncbi:hypothetical protein N8198_02770 [Gammaproteobacteria bacterium]|nr:hypothetical protein [Gammaproteobacteria bacterium]